MVATSLHCFNALGLIILQLCVLLVVGLYEDQVGKYDWRQQFVGQVRFAEFDQSSGSGRRIVLATNQNVVASLTSKNGAISWRQILEGGDHGRIDAMLHHKTNVVTFNSAGQYVRSWHSNTGHLQWEASFPPVPSKNGGRATFLGTDKNNLAVQSGEHVAVFDSSKGKEVWSKQLSSSGSADYKFLGASDNSVVVGGLSTGGVLVAKFKSDGSEEYNKILPAFWSKSTTQCVVLGVKFLVCYDDSTDSLQWSPLAAPELFKSTNLHSLNLAFTSAQLINLPTTGGNYFAVKLSDSNHAIFKISSVGVQLVKELKDSYAIDASKFEDDDVLSVIAVKDGTQNLEIRSYNMETGLPLKELTVAITLTNYHGQPVQLVSLLVKKKDGNTAYRGLVAMEDHSMFMTSQTGKISWIREEALASISAVEMVDLPVSENQAKFEDEFGSNGRDVLGMVFKRFQTQLSQLQTFILHVKARLLMNARHHQHHMIDEDVETEDDDEDEDYMTRDDFNLHKMIVAVTTPGKIFGIDSTRGKIVWQHYLKDIVPFEKLGHSNVLLYVQRTTAHFPHPPQCAVLGKHKVSGNGLLFYFNPITGAAIEEKQGTDLGHTVSVASLLSIVDDHFLKGILMMDNDKKIHLYPKSMMAQVVQERNAIFIFTVNSDTGSILGYGLRYDQGLKSEQLWSVNIPAEAETITGLAAKRSIEQVHSQGKVLADRSVLYKYVNPNLVAISAESVATADKSFFTIYLLDTVSGHMLFQATHKRARGPVNMVHSENWIVYNYWNVKSRRNEVAVLELYEGASQHNATAFSSMDPPPLPIVMRQSYIMPTSISALGSTITEKGLTTKNVILALNNGHLQEIPKMWFDPRRPVTPTPQHREEGVPPYIPELPYDTLAMCNYNQSVFNIRGIHTAPAGLESTSLLLAYGLDMFYTKVTPSKMFDVLKEDFDYFFISCVLTAMIVVTVVAQKLSARKALKKAWK